MEYIDQFNKTLNKIILKQFYFELDNEIYKQSKKLAMDSLLSVCKQKHSFRK